MAEPARDIVLLPDQVFCEGKLLGDRAVHIVDGRLAQVTKCTDISSHARPLPGILTPGLIDLQVNGGGGVLFNTSPTPAGIEAILGAHRSLGTSHILPTVITDRPEVLEKAVDAVLSAWGMRGLVGIHIEGPHISVQRRGTHAAEYVRPLSEDTKAHVARLRARGIPTMITLAPDVVPPAEIAALARTGAIVSLGHSDATFEQAEAALAAGARCFTHLFNAMSQMTGRAPGMVGAALRSGAHAGFICDGYHVSDTMLAIALDAKRDRDRMFLVSDAMPTVGGPEEFELYGNTIRVDDGRLVNSSGSLAGAHVSMAESVTRLASHLEVPPHAALSMAITTPARLLDDSAGDPLIGASVRDILVWSADLSDWRRLSDLLPDAGTS